MAKSCSEMVRWENVFDLKKFVFGEEILNVPNCKVELYKHANLVVQNLLYQINVYVCMYVLIGS